jgi:hypothetical protein
MDFKKEDLRIFFSWGMNFLATVTSNQLKAESVLMDYGSKSQKFDFINDLSYDFIRKQWTIK